MLCEVLRYDKDQFKKFEQSNQCKICSRSFAIFGCYVCFCKFSHVLLDCEDILPESAFNLLGNVLEIDPDRRATAESALNHEFFRSLC